MNLARIRLFDALSISYVFHFIIIAIVWGALSLSNKKSEPEKVRMTILLQTPIRADVPTQRPIQKTIPQVPVVQSKQLPIPTPIKTPPLVPSKPTIIPQQPISASTPISIPKAVENIPQAIPKAPKIEENYEEENLGRIRTILAERLKYPKNALRLKQQGETTVTFTIETNREVSHISVTQSSGFELLDDAAKTLIESSASLFPKPAKAVRISVPIAYKLR